MKNDSLILERQIQLRKGDFYLNFNGKSAKSMEILIAFVVISLLIATLIKEFKQ